ncbi:MAG TPA: hypothetical protein VII94_00555 [Candidatus Saccharimonadales bacterium]
MSDELNAVAEHLYPTEQEQPAEKPQQNTAQDSQKEVNMRILRERAESAERRSLELERMVQMNMSQQQTSKIQIDDEDDFDISDDTYIEGKHLKKYVKNLKQELKNTKRQFEEFNQQHAVNQAEMRLKSQFSDFDAVVSKENLEKLAAQKPALYRTILASPDIYDKGFAAYELIKNGGILSDQYQELDKKIDDNRARPRSAANASPQSGDTPLARVGDYDRRILSEERKDQLRRQVEEAKRYKQ